jgi:Cu/Ag efflux pump CusA
MAPNFWADSKTGVGCYVQVQIPQSSMNSLDAVKQIPVMKNGQLHPLLADVAEVKDDVSPGEIDRYNMQRMITITANVSGEDLGRAVKQVRSAIAQAGEVPRGVAVSVRGQVPVMEDALRSLLSGLGIAVLAIFLLLLLIFNQCDFRLLCLQPHRRSLPVLFLHCSSPEPP